jgi:hypothetical protein
MVASNGLLSVLVINASFSCSEPEVVAGSLDLFRHRLRGCEREFQMMYPLLWSYQASSSQHVEQYGIDEAKQSRDEVKKNKTR